MLFVKISQRPCFFWKIPVKSSEKLEIRIPQEAIFVEFLEGFIVFSTFCCIVMTCSLDCFSCRKNSIMAFNVSHNNDAQMTVLSLGGGGGLLREDDGGVLPFYGPIFRTSCPL